MKKILCLFLMVVIMFVGIMNTGSNVNASSNEEKNPIVSETVGLKEKTFDLSVRNKETDLEAIESVTIVEDYLKDNNTTVVKQYEMKIESLRMKLNDSVSKEEANFLANQVQIYIDLLSDYQKYTSSRRYYEQSLVSTTSTIEENLVYVDPSLPYVAYVASVIAVFDQRGYDFAEELLVHARDNDVLDSYYEPVEGRDVTYSDVWWDDVVGSTSLSGTGEFPNLGDDASTNDDDLLYAIHNFSYTKSESGNTIVITDRYDYVLADYGNVFLGFANNTMVIAQTMGVITPYMVDITRTTTSSTSNPSSTNLNISNTAQYRYHEEIFTLGASEKKEFKITFSNSGVRTLQTFGHKDTYLDIYNSNGTRINYDDDDGYKLNAFTAYYFSANVEYTVKVKFYSSNENGEIKMVILPSNSYSNYEAMTNWTSSTVSIYGYLEPGEADLFTYTSSSTTSKTLETNERPGYDQTDMYMFLIDPRHSTYKTSNELFPHVYDDDGGVGLHSKIDKRICEDVPYFIVITSYYPQTTTKWYKFTID